MRRSRIVTAAAVLSLGLATLAARADETLTIGSPAPKLQVGDWVKGDKVDALKDGQIYVVEFWATWCGPCRASIPHVSDLAEKYKDKVTFAGVSVWEQDVADVEPFLKEMGEKMAYNVAIDDVPEGKKGDEGVMATTWLAAAEESGIPVAFVVGKDGNIAWIGHPMEMDEPLAEIVEGKWDVAAAATARKEEKELQAKTQTFARKLSEALGDNDTKAAIKLIDEFLVENPKLEPQLAMAKLQLLSKEDAKAAAVYQKKLVDEICKDNPQALNNLAWEIVDPEKEGKPVPDDLALALKAAERANELTKDENGPILDTLARARFLSGDAKGAADAQEKAIKYTDDPDDAMKDRLEEYKKAAESKASE
jgi:thiol-disulfide isomerase/thioredoxin